MPTQSAACAECTRSFPVSSPTEGKRLRCPYCGNTFQMTTESSAPSKSSAAARSAAPAALPDWSVVPSNTTTPAEPKTAVPTMSAEPRPEPKPVVPANAVSVEPIPVQAAPAPVEPVESEGSRAPNRGLILLSIFGGLLVLGGAALGMALHFSKKEDAQQAKNDPGAKPGEQARGSGNSGRIVGGRSGPRGYSPPVGNDPGRGGPPRPGGNGGNPPPPPPPPPPPASRSTLPPELQEKVNKAIDAGVVFLMEQQKRSGVWGRSYQVGTTSLVALTLLECGVDKNNPRIQAAANYIRQSTPKYRQSRATYELSLAILFLDKLGDKRDDPLIQHLALRIIASQTAAGGWHYPLNTVFTPQEENLLLTVMDRTRPRLLSDLETPDTQGRLTGLIAQRNGGEVPEPEPNQTKLKPLSRPGVLPNPPGAMSGNEELTKLYPKLPQKLKNINALKPPEVLARFPKSDRSDNSNTQFAILALWAAARHGVPTERALTLLVKRFRSSQERDGGWAYPYRAGGTRGSKPTMTCAGLLGLAVGYGLTAGAVDQKREDPLITKALDYLGNHIDTPRAHTGRQGGDRINMYYMWSIERVGVLFGISKIAGKDWYKWGAKLLVARQQRTGSWNENNFPGGSNPVLDTSFALLFLKRANLAQDLSEKLQFVVEVKGIR